MVGAKSPPWVDTPPQRLTMSPVQKNQTTPFGRLSGHAPLDPVEQLVRLHFYSKTLSLAKGCKRLVICTRVPCLYFSLSLTPGKTS